MTFPDAIHPARVGEYPATAGAGGGYFYDEVLEYRVWCHPDPGEDAEEDGSDYYYAFASYAEALECAAEEPGAEAPLVLIRQYEWVREPTPGRYLHERGERVAEWRVEWLSRGPRQPGAIEAFLRARAEGAVPDDGPGVDREVGYPATRSVFSSGA